MKRHRLKLLGFAVLFGLLVFLLEIYDFLAINLPVDGNILVVESWFWQSSAMKEVMEEFNQGHYKWLVTVGAPIDYMNQKSSAEVAARRLRELGVDESRIIVLPVPAMKLHQTYTFAVTLRNWMIRSKTETSGVNVFTLGTHARKSLVLFRRALGPGMKVGVIAGTEDNFDASRWWLSARGIYWVSGRTIGYVYAIFWPLPNEWSG